MRTHPFNSRAAHYIAERRPPPKHITCRQHCNDQGSGRESHLSRRETDLARNPVLRRARKRSPLDWARLPPWPQTYWTGRSAVGRCLYCTKCPSPVAAPSLVASQRSHNALSGCSDNLESRSAGLAPASTLRSHDALREHWAIPASLVSAAGEMSHISPLSSTHIRQQSYTHTTDGHSELTRL